MTKYDLTHEQTAKIAKVLWPASNYLFRLRKRMWKTFECGDELLKAVEAAYDALNSLSITLHYLGCDAEKRQHSKQVSLPLLRMFDAPVPVNAGGFDAYDYGRLSIEDAEENAGQRGKYLIYVASDPGERDGRTFYRCWSSSWIERFVFFDAGTAIDSGILGKPIIVEAELRIAHNEHRIEFMLWEANITGTGQFKLDN